MKAIIVTVNDELVEKLTPILKIAGYDTIVYKWMLKALDNIEEIMPQLVIINTQDYPRHWKTFIQCASDIQLATILFAPDGLSGEEQKKADSLNVRGVFSGLTADDMDKLRQILQKVDDIYSGNPIPDNAIYKASSKKEIPEVLAENSDSALESAAEKQEASPPSLDNTTSDIGTETPEIKADSKDDIKEETQSETVSQMPEIKEDTPETLQENVAQTSQENTFQDAEIDEELQQKKDEDMIITKEEQAIAKFTIPENSQWAKLRKEKQLPKQCAFVFTNPNNGLFVTGKTSGYDGNAFEFTPYLYEDACYKLKAGDIIKEATLQLDSRVKLACVAIENIGKSIVFSLHK